MKKYLLILILPLLALSNQALAGWPVGKYHYILAPSYSLYTATNSWDRDGNYIKNSDQHFYAHTFGLYAARGLSRKLDISASLPITFQSINYKGINNSFVGLGDFQLGLNYVLNNSKYANYTTLYIGGIIPMYNNTDTRIMGLGAIGGTARLSNSGNITQKAFYSVDLGFSQYIGEDPPQQYSATVTLGYLIDKYNQITADINGVKSISENKTLSLNTFANRDYEYLKVSAGYGHAISRRVNVNLSGFYTLTGRNTGQGIGGALSVLVRLPNPKVIDKSKSVPVKEVKSKK